MGYDVAGTLMGQLPGYFRPVIEFQEILKAHGHAVNALEGMAARVRDNLYVTTCDGDTASYYEGLFGITCRPGDALEFRRMRLLSKFNTIVPFSVGFLRDRLDELYGKGGYAMEADAVALTLKIKVTSDRYGAVDLLYDLLWDIVPAHIQVIANQEASNRVYGKLHVGGQVTGSTLIQTVYFQTETLVPSEANISGAFSGAAVRTIKIGGET